MPKQKIFKFSDFEGRGATITEAKDNCMRAVEGSLRGTFTPRIIRWRGMEVLIWREPASGWYYKTIRADCFENGSQFTRELGGGATLLIASGSSSNGDGGDDGLERTIMQVLSNMAQLAWDGVETESPILTDKGAQDNFKSWVRFQLNYKAIVAEHPDWTRGQIDQHMFNNRM